MLKSSVTSAILGEAEKVAVKSASSPASKSSLKNGTPASPNAVDMKDDDSLDELANLQGEKNYSFLSLIKKLFLYIPCLLIDFSKYIKESTFALKARRQHINNILSK